MLTGNLVRVRTSKARVIPLYLNRDDPSWLEVAESLLLIFREGVGTSRGELEAEIDAMLGDDPKTLAHRGLAKVLEDRAEFEMVSEVAPDVIREKVFSAAAAERLRLKAGGRREHFHRDAVLASVAAELGIDPEKIASSLFADLKDEARMLSFDDLTAQRLVDRYNVALAQAVLLRSTLMTAEVRREKPARYRQLFRWLKFHRLLHRVEGSMETGYTIHIDGPLSLFQSTNKYGFQMAMFLPALLLCDDFRLDAELRWGPRKEPRTFHLESADGLISHYQDAGTYTPPELNAFVARFRQIAPAWEITEATDVLELGREGVWVPDYKFIHRKTGTDVYVDIVGFWKKSSLERIINLLPRFGPPRYLLAISEKMKVDEEAMEELKGPILRFKEIPNAIEMASMLERFIGLA